MKSFPINFLSLLIPLLVCNVHAGGVAVTGNVADDSNRPISGLTIMLTPPNRSYDRERVTVTNHAGEFEFTNVRPGKYLLEAQQYLTPIHRQVIDTQQQPSVHIVLRRTDTTSVTSQDISKLLANIDADDYKTRKNAVNELALNKERYATNDVVNAVLDAMGDESITGLSEQGRINCLTILARRSDEAWAWTSNQSLRVKGVIAFYKDKKLSRDESFAFREFADALQKNLLKAL
jgi:hypothetical protein